MAGLMIELAKRFPGTIIGMVVVNEHNVSMHVGAYPPAVDIPDLFRIAADGCEETPPQLVVEGIGLMPNRPPNGNDN